MSSDYPEILSPSENGLNKEKFLELIFSKFSFCFKQIDKLNIYGLAFLLIFAKFYFASFDMFINFYEAYM
jgi:hypothetical protein